MSQPDSFLHTTHRTVTWFRKVFQSDELVLAAPFQRNPVWSPIQKSYLIDTILNGLPIPELYMQDVGNELGDERHIVVDGQQRIRAVLDFVTTDMILEGDDVGKAWRGKSFENLSADEKMDIFNYKFVVRVLPPKLGEEDIRKIFSRLNKSVVPLNEQELRNATYWGPFIKAIQFIADQDPFWANCGVFSANDYRRMLDQEFISELAIAYLHGPQNKKDKLDLYYRTYEEAFDRRDELVKVFQKVTSEIERIRPKLSKTRWLKKSDFYTLFIAFALRSSKIPRDEGALNETLARLLELGDAVDTLLRLEEEDWASTNADVVAYARNVSRAASDRGSRIARSTAFAHFVLGEEPLPDEAPAKDQSESEVAS